MARRTENLGRDASFQYFAQQADLLKKKTHGLVEGRVDILRNSDDDSAPSHWVFFVSPNLDEYAYRLLAVSHPVGYYPLLVESHSGSNVSCTMKMRF